MKILITGHKGFVGKQLFERLRNEGHTVIGYDKGDSFPEQKIDITFHLAANPKALESVKNPELAMENIQLTFNVLNWMRTSGLCNKIIFASSTKIPGLDTPYSASKFASENLIEAFCKSYNFGGVCLRFSNLYGQNDRSDRFIPIVIEKALSNGQIEIYGKEGSFIYIDDCIDIYVKTMDAMEIGKNKVYLVVNEKSSLVSVAEKIIKLTNSKSMIKLDEGLKKCLKQQ
jgi:nucleoside-diphosphate-sugar epimerase